MNSTAYRAALMSLVLVLSSLAGCIASEEEEDPTILVSTYHVAELVSAVVGDTLDVEIISPSNVPVHDFEPSVADLDRLMNSEIFFYHGLGLEPWVETTLDALGEDAPIAVMTHTMPSGQDTLDYESLLISNLCEVLTDGPFESTTLGTMSDEHDDHDDHDDHSDEEDDHDEHNETDDEHGDHDEHDEDGEEITPETALQYFDTNSDGSLSWEEFWVSWEEGEDDDHDEHNETDDDDHGDHDEHDEDGEEITPETALEYFDTNSDGSLSWEEFWVSWEEGEDDDHDEHNETDDDDHGDHDGEHEEEMSVLMEIFNESDANMDGLLDINELEHFIHEIMELEEGHHEGHAHAEAEETIQNPAGCPTDTVISIFHMEEGEYVLEFESEHDEDFNMAALKMLGGHAHHDHGHDDHDEDGHDDGQDEHDDHWAPETCHDEQTHETHDEYTTEEDCEAAGHMWMEEEHHGLPEIHADFVAHTLSFPEEHDDHDEHDEEHNETDDHSDEEDDHDNEEGHHEVGYVVIHIEEEGDYGFAIPTDVEFFVLMNDGHDHGHDDHDDHSDEEDDHSDEEDDHSDEEDDHDGHSSEEIEYDPHSWLSPLAFRAQVDLVVEALSQQYPEHKDTFEENAEAFKAELDSLHMKYSAISDECEQRTVVANHNAYSYIGNTYDIRFVTVHGLDPEGEPSAADIAEVLEQIEEDGLTILFVEEYTNPDAVAGIVEQTKSGTMPEGISIQTLYTMEMPPMDSEDDYLSLMEKNLDNLKAGMGC